MKRELLLEKLKAEAKSTSINSLSKRIDVPFATLHRILNGTYRQGRVDTWDKIERYMRRSKQRKVQGE